MDPFSVPLTRIGLADRWLELLVLRARGCIDRRELTQLRRRTLPLFSEHLFEKCTANQLICSATDVTGRIRFVKSVCLSTSFAITIGTYIR